MNLDLLYPYDIETYPNVFTMYIGNAGTRECWGFEISDRKDQRVEMINLLRKIKKEGAYMVGYNNNGFDYPVVHYILRNQGCSVKDIYDKAQAIIDADDDEKWDHIIPSWKFLIPQIDLYKIHHFDNANRRTSLKVLEFNMRSKNIEDLPFPVGIDLNDEEKDVLLKYNKHDMAETCKFLLHSIPQIEFRMKLTEQYDKDFINHNDGKIGKDYFIMKLEEEVPGICFDKKTRKARQTPRSVIDLSECVFPYVKFERPEFNAVLDWIKKQKITETKGVFTDILESDLGELAQYAQLRTKRQKLFRRPSEKQLEERRKKHPMGWVDVQTLKSGKESLYWCWNVADGLNCIVDGFQYDFGLGGIHGSVSSQIIRSTEEKVIVDQDVASYYPNMAIYNRIYPEHLGESFCDIYLDVYEQRKSFAKGTPENAMLKLALNSVYGDSNNRFSPFYDSKYTMSITIGGQLSLCMLAEMLLKVEGLEMIQVNTDGLTYYVDVDKKDEAQQICNEWEKITKLQLEDDYYEYMAIRDVNNYIAKTTDGKLKNKGAYVWKDLQWHQNQSMTVVAMAAEKYINEEEDISYFIKNHTEKMDFMLRAKVPRSSKLVVVDELGNDNQVQNITRYYISKSGDGELVKIMPPLAKERWGKKWKHLETDEEVITETKTEHDKIQRKADKGEYEFIEDFILENKERRIGINTGWKVKVCNDLDDYTGDIDHEFYIQEAKSLVNFIDQQENQNV